MQRREEVNQALARACGPEDAHVVRFEDGQDRLKLPGAEVLQAELLPQRFNGHEGCEVRVEALRGRIFAPGWSRRLSPPLALALSLTHTAAWCASRAMGHG
eukprot:3377805-Rhodomonas_salina.2